MSFDDPRMEAQRAEFDAVKELLHAYNNLPPIVDDEYPEMRHHYETAVRNLIRKLHENNRIPAQYGEADRFYHDIEVSIPERSRKFKDDFKSSFEKQRYMALALAGEVGEACNLVKKEWREGRLDGAKLLDEVSDVFVYWLLLCHSYGWTMRRVVEHADAKAERKLQKVLADRANR